MSVIIGEDKPKVGAAYYQRKIRCPGHWLVPPQVDVYLREPVKELKNCSNKVELKSGRVIKIKKNRIARDIFGNKRLDWKKLYELRAKGIVLHPVITASYAIENIYDPKSLICFQCQKLCLEGKGIINELGIKRLNGQRGKK
jgi:hypothetical protein